MKAIPMHMRRSFSIAALSALALAGLTASAALAQTQNGATGTQLAQNTRGDDYLPPWQRGQESGAQEGPGAPQPIVPPRNDAPPPSAAASPPPPSGGYASPPPPATGGYNDQRYEDRTAATRGDLPPPPQPYSQPSQRDYAPPPLQDDSYSSSEIVDAGHRFFGGVSKGLAEVVEHAFAKQGRPNGYILGEEAGGAFVAGLRYGEGTLNTKNAGSHRIYWQGPSFGYDFGAEGSKTLILVYNLRHVDQLYNRFAGVDGSAFLVGGVGVTFQTYDDVVLAPIRSGVGLRLGANVGYLKYTRTPTWNPF
jgi:hypothetical protein